MKITVHLVVCDDDGPEETITEVVVLEKAGSVAKLLFREFWGPVSH